MWTGARSKNGNAFICFYVICTEIDMPKRAFDSVEFPFLSICVLLDMCVFSFDVQHEEF